MTYSQVEGRCPAVPLTRPGERGGHRHVGAGAHGGQGAHDTGLKSGAQQPASVAGRLSVGGLGVSASTYAGETAEGNSATLLERIPSATMRAASLSHMETDRCWKHKIIHMK